MRKAERIELPDVNGRAFRLHLRAEGRLEQLLAGDQLLAGKAILEFKAACRLRDDRERAAGATATSLSRFRTSSAGLDDDVMVNRLSSQSGPRELRAGGQDFEILHATAATTAASSLRF